MKNGYLLHPQNWIKLHLVMLSRRSLAAKHP